MNLRLVAQHEKLHRNLNDHLGGMAPFVYTTSPWGLDSSWEGSIASSNGEYVTAPVQESSQSTAPIPIPPPGVHLGAVSDPVSFSSWSRQDPLPAPRLFSEWQLVSLVRHMLIRRLKSTIAYLSVKTCKQIIRQQNLPLADSFPQAPATRMSTTNIGKCGGGKPGPGPDNTLGSCGCPQPGHWAYPHPGCHFQST